MQPSLVSDSAVQPTFYVFDACNVAWSLSDKKRTAVLLGQELVKLWHHHKFHAIGLSEIFEIEYKDEALRAQVETRREGIRDVLLETLGKVSGRPWRARLDAHHMYIYEESLNCVKHEYVSLEVPTQPWRRVQHLVFLPAECDVPLHVYHAHCPSAGNNKPRKFAPHARKAVVKTLCDHMQNEHTLYWHGGVEQPDFPAVLITGDFNLSETNWRSYLMSNLPKAIYPNVHVLKSTRTGKCRHGDLTIAINVVTEEMETPTWTTFSDAHDVVIAKVCIDPLTTTPPASPCQRHDTRSIASPASCAEQPIYFRLVSEKMGIFLLPACATDHRLRAQAAAEESKAMIKQFDPNTMMLLPLTIPPEWGAFLFGKVTVCSWAGLKTLNKDGVTDDTFKDETLKVFHLIANKQYTLPDVSDMKIEFMLGRQESDAQMNGPVIVVRNLEPIRGIIDAVREDLNLAPLHPDSKLHLSICRLTGKNADGDRDDKLLRDRVQPHWPLLGNGFPDVLSALPMLPRQRLEHAQASAGSSTDCAEQPAISEISSHWDVRLQAVSRGVSANRKIMNAPISRADVSQVEEASAPWMFVGGKHVPTTSRVSAQDHSQMQEKMMCRRKRLQDEMTNDCAEQCSSRCEPVCPASVLQQRYNASTMQAVQHPAVPRDKNNNALRRDRVNSRGVSATLPAWTTRCSDGNPASVLQQPGDFDRHPPSVDPAAKNAAQPALPADVVSNDDAVVGSAAQPAVPGSAEQPALPADVLSSDDAVVGSAEQPAWYNDFVVDSEASRSPTRT